MRVHVKAGLRKRLRNKNPLSQYLSNRLCLPGDRDWHHFLLVSVYVYTQCPRVKKKKNSTKWYVNVSWTYVWGWVKFTCVVSIPMYSRALLQHPCLCQVQDWTCMHRVCLRGRVLKADCRHICGVCAMCACGQPDCTLCQGKHGQLMPSGRTTWHRGTLYGSTTYWSS